MPFKRVKPEELSVNPFTVIGKDWLLITAGTEKECNTMTASWGGLGVIWGKPSATAYIRQSRYTKEFVDREDLFTLSVFDESFRPALNLCGTVSGRDRDKIQEAGLTPMEVDGTTAFEEAKMIFVCRKQYHQYMGPEGFDVQENDEKWYVDKNYHTMYIGSIEAVLVRED